MAHWGYHTTGICRAGGPNRAAGDTEFPAPRGLVFGEGSLGEEGMTLNQELDEMLGLRWERFSNL